MRILLVLVMLAAPAFGQPDTPTQTPTSTPTHTPTPTYAAPPTPHCTGSRQVGQVRFVDRTIANTTEVALIQASAADQSIVLTQLCASTAGATIVTLTYEQPYQATTMKLDFAAAGFGCVDVAGKCLPDGIDLLVKQSASVSTQITASYVEQ